MASRISYQKKNSAGTRYETTPSLKRRIKHVSGYKCKDVIPLEGNLASFTADGIEYVYTKSVYFSVDGFGYFTDFETVNRAPEYDSPARKQERAKREALHFEQLACKYMNLASDASEDASDARYQHDQHAADVAAAMAEKYAQKAEKYARDAKSAAAVAASEASADFAAAAAKHAEVARAWASDAAHMAADTAAHIEQKGEEGTMQNAEKYIDPIKWTYSEITTADESGEAYGCIALIPNSEVHYYQSAEGLEVIVYQSNETDSKWDADIYNAEGETEVAGAAGATPEEAFMNAVITYCVYDARHTEKDVEDVINVATARAFSAFNDGMYPDDSDPVEVWEELNNVRDKVMQLEPMHEDEPEPADTIAAQLEREQNGQNAARVMNSLATAARYAEAMSDPDTHANIRKELQAIAARLTREGYRVDYVEAIDLWTVHA